MPEVVDGEDVIVGLEVELILALELIPEVELILEIVIELILALALALEVEALLKSVTAAPPIVVNELVGPLNTKTSASRTADFLAGVFVRGIHRPAINDPAPIVRKSSLTEIRTLGRLPRLIGASALLSSLLNDVDRSILEQHCRLLFEKGNSRVASRFDNLGGGAAISYAVARPTCRRLPAVPA